jgi:hypothetical protein
MAEIRGAGFDIPNELLKCMTILNTQSALRGI